MHNIFLMTFSEIYIMYFQYIPPYSVLCPSPNPTDPLSLPNFSAFLFSF